MNKETFTIPTEKPVRHAKSENLPFRERLSNLKIYFKAILSLDLTTNQLDRLLLDSYVTGNGVYVPQVCAWHKYDEEVVHEYFEQLVENGVAELKFTEEGNYPVYFITRYGVENMNPLKEFSTMPPIGRQNAC